MDDLVKQGATAAKAGDYSISRKFLTEVISYIPMMKVLWMDV